MANSPSNQLTIDLERRAGELAPPVYRLPQGIERASQIVRHYRWSQMARRIWKLTSRRLGRRRPISIREQSSAPTVRNDVSSLTPLARVFVNWRGNLPSNRQCDLGLGSILLLGERREMGSPLDWKFERTTAAPQLWRFQLHYHEFLLASAADSTAESQQRAWEAIESWIDAYEPGTFYGDDDAWHPYCISRRLPTWIWLWQSVGPSPSAERFLVSFRNQANYLAENLEFDPGGNHLLENLTALGLAANFLEDTKCKAWLDLVERRLRVELPRQILSHGEHFERSPTYHCHVTANLLALSQAARSVRPSLAEYCESQAQRMMGFIASIVHPDGEIPLFGDSVFDESPGIVQLRELAKLAGLDWPAQPDNGQVGPYWVQRRGRSAIIFDAGPVGPRALPAHAHCDLMGFEGSVEGNRWFVDSGNFHYEADSMRRYCRSSLAHNVVVVDDREQCDVWSKFRMGFRGEPIRFESGQRGGADWAFARHNAYRRSHIRFHDRLMVSWGDAWICGDFSHTLQRPKFVGYLHLAPDVAIERLGERRFELRIQNTRRRIDFFGVEDVQIALGWYCPAFGKRMRNQCFIYRQTQAPPTPLGWLLDAVDSQSSVEVDGRRLYWRLAAANFEWSFD